MSIKTVFVSCPDGMRVWGVENVNETEDLDWSAKAPGEADAFYNKYYSNGWTNTWKADGKVRTCRRIQGGEIYDRPDGQGKRDQLMEGHDKSGQCKVDVQQGSLPFWVIPISMRHMPALPRF